MLFGMIDRWHHGSHESRYHEFCIPEFVETFENFFFSPHEVHLFHGPSPYSEIIFLDL